MEMCRIYTRGLITLPLGIFVLSLMLRARVESTESVRSVRKKDVFAVATIYSDSPSKSRIIDLSIRGSPTAKHCVRISIFQRFHEISGVSLDFICMISRTEIINMSHSIVGS